MWSGWRRLAAIVLLLSGFLGCALPSSSQTPPLTAAAAKHTLDSWNSGFCKVADFYGFCVSGENPAGKDAYVLIANPGDKVQKPVVYAAVQLLTPSGRPALVSHQLGDAQLRAEPPAGLGQPDHPGEPAAGSSANESRTSVAILNIGARQLVPSVARFSWPFSR